MKSLGGHWGTWCDERWILIPALGTWAPAEHAGLGQSSGCAGAFQGRGSSLESFPCSSGPLHLGPWWRICAQGQAPPRAPHPGFLARRPHPRWPCGLRQAAFPP